MKPSDFRLKLINHEYQGRPYFGVTACIKKIIEPSAHAGEWRLEIVENNPGHSRGVVEVHPTMRKCLAELYAYGDLMVKTTNILNLKAGEFDIALRDKGGCCDPGTERYHSM